ncbi:Predicted oxidoreductase [Pedococcus dokdonensis]|uniref:Predicted oxidoreductase n=1 Tax=Pedococcus dokdonensis TaxID=443156 RepID=A0A1H0TP60_9MICO|nr:aldo/keto reductase [Pedococcus dokdonensis]SDP55827.1 Predicted oxidoreductase [Pedococcus dokdonensis]
MSTGGAPAGDRRIDLGHGLEVSRLGFGGMAITHVYGATDPAEGLRTLHHAVDAGVTFIDTADVYGEPREGVAGPAGTNEELVGQLLRDRRDEVQLATKFGITGVPNQGPTATPVRGDAPYVRSAAEASLRRLGTDVIDLYYLHRRDVSVPIEETVGAMAELVEAGKVRHLGLSEVTAGELRAAAAVHPITAVQSEWSIWSRDVEAQVVPAAVEVGAGFVPYSPLGRGFLTGAMTREAVAGSMLKGHPRFDEGFDANQRVVEVVSAVAAEVGATPAQVALAWLYAQGERLGLPVVPIPGTRRAERVDENLGALDVRLGADHLSRLDEAAALVQGDRNLSKDPAWISSGRE